MALADYQPPTRTVGKGKNAFDVRGLSLSDIQVLATAYYADLENLVVMYGNVSNDVLAMSNTQAFLIEIARTAPALAADIIVLASDAEDRQRAHDIARRLPFPLQIDALEKVTKLTFEDVGGPKNFFATLQSLAGGMLPPGVARLLETSRPPSEVASGTSSPSSGET